MKPQILLLPIVAVLLTGCAHEQVTYETAYLRPLASPGGKFGALPPTVQNTVRAEAGSAEIVDVATIHRLDEVDYEVYFRNDKILPPLLVAANGSVLNPDFSVAVSAVAEASSSASPPTISRIQRADLTPAAVKIIDERAVGTQIESIDRATWGDRALYIITFADEAEHPKLYITSDGTVLKDSQK